MAITYRLVKGSPLTHTEMDDNFIASFRNTLISGQWAPISAVGRLRITGTGTINLAVKNALDVTTNLPDIVVSGATNQIEWIYPGDDGIFIMATFPISVTVEVI